MKFGLNIMIGTCDSLGYFLDVKVKLFPRFSSDFYAFLNSNLRKKVETRNFLMDGLCLYGDNTHSNKPFMIVPFKGAKSTGAKDAFNYFHSSLRINIECAFGMLVHHFGML